MKRETKDLQKQTARQQMRFNPISNDMKSVRVREDMD